MEGYINLRLPLWKRRLLTRLVTLIPLIIIGCCIHFNEQEFEQLIIIAQIILSVALPFTLFPLIIITSNHQIMGQYANRHWQMISYLIIVLALTFLNFAALF